MSYEPDSIEYELAAEDRKHRQYLRRLRAHPSCVDPDHPGCVHCRDDEDEAMEATREDLERDRDIPEPAGL